jgi:subtilisin family serine protease
MLAPGGTPLWWAGHGTFVAGLVVQRAPAVELEMESVLGKDDGTGPSVWQVARSLGRYARSGADIVNLSFGCFTLDGQPPLVLERAVNRLTASMVVVAAAGNYGEIEKAEPPNSHTPIWPAAFEEVVAVGANTAEGAPAGFTPQAPWIDLRAIGVDVDSSYLDGNVELDTETVAFTGAARWSGTSFAAASVAGAIAARTEPGRRTAHEALDELRAGAYGGSDSGIEVLAASKL